jgi:hypothetical protein
VAISRRLLDEGEHVHLRISDLLCGPTAVQAGGGNGDGEAHRIDDGT